MGEEETRRASAVAPRPGGPGRSLRGRGAERWQPPGLLRPSVGGERAQPRRVGMAGFGALILGRWHHIAKNTGTGQRGGEEEDTEPKETTKSLKKHFLLPPAMSPSSFCLHASLWATSWNVDWFGGKSSWVGGQASRRKRGQLQARPGEEGPAAGRRDGSLTGAGADGQWKRMARQRPLCCKRSSHLQGQRVSPFKCSDWAHCCHGESRR